MGWLTKVGSDVINGLKTWSEMTSGDQTFCRDISSDKLRHSIVFKCSTMHITTTLKSSLVKSTDSRSKIRSFEHFSNKFVTFGRNRWRLLWPRFSSTSDVAKMFEFSDKNWTSLLESRQPLKLRKRNLADTSWKMSDKWSVRTHSDKSRRDNWNQKKNWDLKETLSTLYLIRPSYPGSATLKKVFSLVNVQFNIMLRDHYVWSSHIS